MELTNGRQYRSGKDSDDRVLRTIAPSVDTNANMVHNTSIRNKPPALPVRSCDGHESRSATQSVEIVLADVGCAVPETATARVVMTSAGELTIARNGETFVLERDRGWQLTGVVGRDELPARVPCWVRAICERAIGITEVSIA